METMKKSGLWSSLGKLYPQGCYVFSLVDQPGIKLSLHGYHIYIVSPLDKPGIREIWSFKLNLATKINISLSQK